MDKDNLDVQLSTVRDRLGHVEQNEIPRLNEVDEKTKQDIKELNEAIDKLNSKIESLHNVISSLKG